MKMKKTISIFAVFITAVFIISALTVPFCALPAIDTKTDCSLTLCYGCEDIEINVYKIADFEQNGNITLTKAFEGYPVNVNGVTARSEWDNITSTLAAFIAMDKLTPDKTARTDKDGCVRFENLSAGLYLTLSVTVKEDDVTKIFEDFITALPTADGDVYNYDVTAYPKHSSFTPEPSETEYKVIKQWSDNGFTEHRPDSIEVEIYKDGVLHTTQTLNAQNNWCYKWKAADDGSKWRAVEKNVPTGYSVTVSEKETTFIVTNSYHNPPSAPPDTGDMFNPILWGAAMFLSGILIILIARGLRHEADK